MILLAAWLLVAGPQPSVSVCDLTAEPARYAGQRVRVAALVENDGHAIWRLRDRACERSVVRLDIDAEKWRDRLPRNGDLSAVTADGEIQLRRDADGGVIAVVLKVDRIG